MLKFPFSKVRFSSFLFKPEGLSMESTPLALYGITTRPRMLSAVGLYFSYPFGLDYNMPPTVDSMLAEARFHAATGCGFHADLWSDLVQKNEEKSDGEKEFAFRV